MIYINKVIHAAQDVLAPLFMKKAEKVFVLASSDKFEKNGLLKICDTLPEYTFVTDSKIKKEYKNIYRDNGIKIISSKGEI